MFLLFEKSGVKHAVSFVLRSGNQLEDAFVDETVERLRTGGCVEFLSDALRDIYIPSGRERVISAKWYVERDQCKIVVDLRGAFSGGVDRSGHGDVRNL